jgi:hypothetical protein
MITGYINMSSTSYITVLQVKINGSDPAGAPSHIGESPNGTAHVTSFARLAVNDIVEFFAFQSSGSPVTGTNGHWGSIHMIAA